jgi:hypothetical protein
MRLLVSTRPALPVTQLFELEAGPSRGTCPPIRSRSGMRTTKSQCFCCRFNQEAGAPACLMLPAMSSSFSRRSTTLSSFIAGITANVTTLRPVSTPPPSSFPLFKRTTQSWALLTPRPWPVFIPKPLTARVATLCGGVVGVVLRNEDDSGSGALAVALHQRARDSLSGRGCFGMLDLSRNVRRQNCLYRSAYFISKLLYTPQALQKDLGPVHNKIMTDFTTAVCCCSSRNALRRSIGSCASA